MFRRLTFLRILGVAFALVLLFGMQTGAKAATKTDRDAMSSTGEQGVKGGKSGAAISKPGEKMSQSGKAETGKTHFGALTDKDTSAMKRDKDKGQLREGRELDRDDSGRDEKGRAGSYKKEERSSSPDRDEARVGEGHSKEFSSMSEEHQREVEHLRPEQRREFQSFRSEEREKFFSFRPQEREFFFTLRPEERLVFWNLPLSEREVFITMEPRWRERFVTLTPRERDVFFYMSPEEREVFLGLPPQEREVFITLGPSVWEDFVYWEPWQRHAFFTMAPWERDIFFTMGPEERGVFFALGPEERGHLRSMRPEERRGFMAERSHERGRVSSKGEKGELRGKDEGKGGFRSREADVSRSRGSEERGHGEMSGKTGADTDRSGKAGMHEKGMGGQSRGDMDKGRHTDQDRHGPK